MKLSDFNSQHPAKRWETLWSWGYLMVKRDLGDRTAALFSVSGFFAVTILCKNDNSVIAVNAYRLEDLPMEYYQLINHDRPFMRTTQIDTNSLAGIAA
jgi:hypothetical protein